MAKDMLAQLDDLQIPLLPYRTESNAIRPVVVARSNQPGVPDACWLFTPAANVCFLLGPGA